MKKKKVFIYCGVPGSGKSTMIKAHYAHVVSADYYFMVNGKYNFDPNRLGDAHGACLRSYTLAITNGAPFVIVDNTNTTVLELAPYVSLALAFGAEVTIHTLWCDPYVAFQRNIHNVPLHSIKNMDMKLRSRQFPTYWNVTNEVYYTDSSGG